MKNKKRIVNLIEETKDQFETILEEMKILEDLVDDLEDLIDDLEE